MERELLDYDLTCWYLNARHVMGLVGATHLEAWPPAVREVAEAGGDLMRRVAVEIALKNALVEWVRAARPPTLGRLAASAEITPGALFTHYSDFFCKGLSAWPQEGKPSTEVPLPQLHCKLDGLVPETELRLDYHPRHLTCSSAWGTLRGRTQLFVLGSVKRMGRNVIEAFPYVVATLIPDLLEASPKGSRWRSRLEVFVEGIDSFERVRQEPTPQRAELARLRGLHESDVIAAFADIIGESEVPKHWGGEQSDLFSDRVLLDGKRIATAFVFKGPSHPHRLTMAHLGRNGDQLVRLFGAPADLLVVQHWGTIDPAVRAHMRAFASDLASPRLFALINGCDTLRVLRAYGRLGV